MNEDALSYASLRSRIVADDRAVLTVDLTGSQTSLCKHNSHSRNMTDRIKRESVPDLIPPSLPFAAFFRGIAHVCLV